MTLGLERSATMQVNHHTMRVSESLRALGRPVVFYPKLAAIFGIPETIFLSHFIYWSDKGSDPDGWIYKSTAEIEEETGLTYEQQRRVCGVLEGRSLALGGHHRTKRILPEAVLEKRYDRPTHRVFFRVNLPAVDRIFSQGMLFPLFAGHLGNPPRAHGESPGGTSGFPSSSISESTTKSTQKEYARKAAHKDFIQFFTKTALKVRRREASIDAAGGRNLKLALKVSDETSLERLALYFLADRKFSKYPPDLKVFLSEGVMGGLRNAHGTAGFSALLDQYVSTHLKEQSYDDKERPTYEHSSMEAIIKSLRHKFSA